MRRGEFGGTLPIIPGLEVAGTIRALGDQVTGLRVGQPVVTLSRPTAGGYAEVALADAAITFSLDDLSPAVDPALAVAVVPNATAALLALDEVAHLRAGERVLIHGATGALASVVGQITREFGPGEVIGTVRSPERFQDAQWAGFDTVVESADFADRLDQRGVDSVDRDRRPRRRAPAREPEGAGAARPPPGCRQRQRQTRHSSRRESAVAVQRRRPRLQRRRTANQLPRAGNSCRTTGARAPRHRQDHHRP